MRDHISVGRNIFYFFGEEKKESVKLIKCLLFDQGCCMCDHTSVIRDFIFFLSREKRKCNINKVSTFDEEYSV